MSILNGVTDLLPELLSPLFDGPEDGRRLTGGDPQGGLAVALQQPLTDYTLVFDVLADAGQTGFGSLLQTDPANSDDGDLFIHSSDGITAAIGIDGLFHGSMTLGEWHRVTLIVDDQGDGTARLTTYIDGVEAGSQSVDADRYPLDGQNGFLIMADDNGETMDGSIGSLSVADGVLGAGTIADLGAPAAGAIGDLVDTAALTLTEFNFGYGSIDLIGAAGDLVGNVTELLPSTVWVDNAIKDYMVTPGSESVLIDLTTVFNGVGLSYTVTSSDGSVVDADVAGDVLEFDPQALGFADIEVTATDALGVSATDSFRVRVASENAYTIAVLPDTQDYATGFAPPKTLFNMTQWLVDNADEMNLEFVTNVGDMVYWNSALEYMIVRAAYDNLDQAGIEYAVTAGNHDMGPLGLAGNRNSELSDYFPADRFQGPDGVYDQEPGLVSNNYHTFTAVDGTKWLALSLEFGPRDDVLRWASDVIEDHLDHQVLITSHNYISYFGRSSPLDKPLYNDSAPQDYGIVNDPEGANDGEAVYRDLVSQYPNIAFVFSGHVFGDGAETQVSYSEFGTATHEMLVNYQIGVDPNITGNGDVTKGANGGNGAMRLITIDPDNDTVWTETYFTELDTYFDAVRGSAEPDRDGLQGAWREHQQTITDIDLGTPDLFAIAKAGDDQVVAAPGAQETASVTLDASRSVDPAAAIVSYEWIDADGTVIATGATPTVALEVGRHDLTLTVTEASGRTNSDDVSVIVTGQRTLLVETFNDGDADGWVDVADQDALQAAFDGVGLGSLIPGGDNPTWLVKGTAASRPVHTGDMPAPEGALYELSDGDAGLVLGAPGAASWSNYTMEATIVSQDKDTIGIYVYYRDQDNHYKLTLDNTANARTLTKVQDGVETVLARDSKGYPFNQDMTLAVTVQDDTILASLDGKTLFDGPVTDAQPLPGGTVGLVSVNQFQSIFDDIVVNRNAPTADAGSDQRVIDRDGDGAVTVTLDGVASFGFADGASYRWSVDGLTVAEGVSPQLTLPVGDTAITLTVTDPTGVAQSDTVAVDVVGGPQILAQDDFDDGDSAGWRFIDEGERGSPADWSVSDGGLVQAADTASRQLGADDPGVWSQYWSPLGDGWHALRKGTYALYDQDEASAWDDVSIETTVTSPSGGGVGVLFRYRDADNHYKLELDADSSFIQLFSLVDGIEQTLWQSQQTYDPSSSFDLRIDAVGDTIQAWVDGEALFQEPLRHGDHDTGTIGLYSWDNPDVRFDDVTVVDPGAASAPAPNALDVSFEFREAGLDHVFGWYDSQTGDAQVIFGELTALGSQVPVGKTVALGDTDLDDVEYFLVTGRQKAFRDAADGADSLTVNVAPGADHGRILIDDGADTIAFDAWFTEPGLNRDGLDHAVALDAANRGRDAVPDPSAPALIDGPTGLLAWEDLRGGGDRDYDDAVFAIDPLFDPVLFHGDRADDAQLV